jgi:Leucine-rich repeat (LRR) protein
MKWNMRKYSIILVLFLIALNGLYSQNNISKSKEFRKIHTYRTIEEAVKEPDSVFYLILEKKNLDTVPKELLLFKNLISLDLRFNNIQELPTWIGELITLKYIYLGDNPITQFPKEFSQLKSLKCINLLGIENLDLYQIFETIDQIDSLEILDLRYCYVREMPENTYKLNQLTELWLNENYLSDEERKKTKGMLPNTFIVFNNSRLTE